MLHHLSGCKKRLTPIHRASLRRNPKTARGYGRGRIPENSRVVLLPPSPVPFVAKGLTLSAPEGHQELKPGAIRPISYVEEEKRLFRESEASLGSPGVERVQVPNRKWKSTSKKPKPTGTSVATVSCGFHKQHPDRHRDSYQQSNESSTRECHQ